MYTYVIRQLRPSGETLKGTLRGHTHRSIFMSDNGLTDKEERYCQLRADGHTKSSAARIAYDGDPRYSNRAGHIVEKREDVQERIAELKAERAEAYGLDYQEQIRRYNQLYHTAVEKGQLSTAAKMLERLDALGGFDAPTKSVSLRGTLGESLKNPSGNIQKDVEKFSGILSTHSENTKHQKIVPEEDPKGIVH